MTDYPPDFSPDDIAFVERVQPYTVTSPERILALRHAVHYINQANIPGDIVECGVYMGGSVMAAMLATAERSSWPRDFWLYDTFEGMAGKSACDVSIDGLDGAHPHACSLDTVKANLAQVGYPGRVTYVKGRVEDTLQHEQNLPASIALLRLDTDWYLSTLCELDRLFPRLSRGGIVLIDDYGHWAGARQAVDEYWQQYAVKTPLFRVDYTGRIGIKVC